MEKAVRKRNLTFPLRLPLSLKDRANQLAQVEGVSLNHFISLAVAEKISRLERAELAQSQLLESRKKA